jgi:hypothetical protein
MNVLGRLARRAIQKSVGIHRRLIAKCRLSTELLAGTSQIYNQECRTLATKLWNQTRGTVFGGPFAGMKIPLVGAYSWMPCLIVGSYEEEIHSSLTGAIVEGTTLVVNIGSAEGYYAVGLARALPEATVVAYEMNTSLWAECHECACLNNVERQIDQQSKCTTADLARVLKPNAIVVIDCEGAEFDLLRPLEVAHLASAAIFCELHEFHNPKIAPEFISRFRNTHFISVINQYGRSSGNYPILDTLTPREKWLALHENRHVAGVPMLGRYMTLVPRQNLSAN